MAWGSIIEEFADAENKIRGLEAVVKLLLRADKKDWDRLEAHLAKDGSGHWHFWQGLMKEVRQALESKDLISKGAP